MISTEYRHFKCLAAFLPLILMACTTPPVLESKSAAVPVGIDLSGNWQVRNSGSGRGGRGSPGVLNQRIKVSQTGGQQRKRSSSGPSAQLFLEYGTSLKITQTRHGLFISYDRSIVEEYTFGENRLIELGPIEALRVSGWDGNSFVVETLDDSGTTLFETWHLENNGEVLVRDVRLSKKEKDSFVDQQFYDRQ